ncbi:MAG TPA: hypothetical protein VLE53_08330 [Gemmatimonadaceae bacterium]|nr:hypothetical protein [Gemmatimonadaceae bacterium]
MTRTSFGAAAMAGVLLGLGASEAATRQGGVPRGGVEVLERMRAMYEGKWYRTLTFLQRTVFHRPDGSTSERLWLEAISGASLLRIDFDSVGSGEGLFFTADSSYTIRQGTVARVRAPGNPFLPLIMGVYLQPVAQTMRELAPHGVDLRRVHANTWKGRPVWVVGAGSPADTAASQFWIDAERLYLVRMLVRSAPTAPMLDVDVDGYVRAGGGWLGTRITMSSGGRPVQTEEYTAWNVDVALDPALFDVRSWNAGRHWYQPVPPPSSAWLGLLPEGETKRKFILDCTGCHQFDAPRAWAGERARPPAEWEASVSKMLGWAGATTGFPVIAHDRDAKATAHWLAEHVTRVPPATTPAASERVTEFPFPVPQDLPHDLAVDRDGRVIVTGMFSHQMQVLDPATGSWTAVAIPVPNGNPRAVDIDEAGNWWVVLGAPNKIARYAPARREWRSFDVGFYPHSLAVGRDGQVWANGHFTKDPELVVRVDTATARADSFAITPHPELARRPGGPIPYELRVGPDGRVWGSELQGNRLFALDPASRRVDTFDMPEAHSGPRRFDIDRGGVLWIPAYATNELVRFDPAAARFTRFALPIADAVPYVVRIDDVRQRVWIGTAAADVVFEFDPATSRFTTYQLPSRGALVRHLAIDPRTRDLWVAYGASPGLIPARIARIRVAQ